jgi:hypothetical protein
MSLIWRISTTSLGADGEGAAANHRRYGRPAGRAKLSNRLPFQRRSSHTNSRIAATSASGGRRVGGYRRQLRTLVARTPIVKRHPRMESRGAVRLNAAPVPKPR